MPFVVDASVAVAWVLDDTKDATADAAWARAKTDRMTVPAIFRVELRNALLSAERRGRITEIDTRTYLATIEALGTNPVAPSDADVALTLARRHRLTAHDAEYLEVAIRYGYPMATLDRDLIRAADALPVELIRPTTP